MEGIPINKGRNFRGKSEILHLLQECAQSGLSIKAFCAGHCIAQATFHNWKHKYGKASGIVTDKPGFTRLQITSSAPANLFAEVGNIKIYQPVSAAYLKELLS